MEIKEEKPDLCDVCHKLKPEQFTKLTVKTDEVLALNIGTVVSVKQEENLESVDTREKDKKPYLCNPYDKRLKDSKILISHMAENTCHKDCTQTPKVLTEIGNKLHAYQSCHESFSDRDNFSGRKERHTFSSRLELSMQETDTKPDLCAEHVSNNLFVCAFCKKVFKKEDDLTRHLAIHIWISVKKEVTAETVKLDEDGGDKFSKPVSEVSC